jgi:hypothetical protein
MRAFVAAGAAAAAMAAGLPAALAQPGPAGAGAAAAVPAPAVAEVAPLRCDRPAPPPGRGWTDAALDALLAQLPQCQDDPGWLVAAGQTLNQARRYGDAADLIERALLLQPALRGARVDYVVALAGSGDVDAARALLADLLAEPDLPAGLRSVLLRHSGSLPLALAGGWRADGSLGLRLGRDSNLLGAPDLQSITLTLGGQLVEVLLDESYRARGGSFRQIEGSVGVSYLGRSGMRWVAGAAWRDRDSPALPAADSRQAELLAEWSAPLPRLPSWRAYASLAGGNLRSPLSAFDARTRVLGLEATAGPECGVRLASDVQDRRYTDNPLLSGRYSGQGLSVVCGGGPRTLASGGYTLLALRTGTDRPDALLRPGGDQRQRAIRLATSQPLARVNARLPGYVTLDAEWSRQQDSKEYSPILDSGRTRTLSRRAIRVEWRWPVSGHGRTIWEPALGFDAVSQSSNISLFRLDSRGPYAALRLRW